MTPRALSSGPRGEAATPEDSCSGRVKGRARAALNCPRAIMEPRCWYLGAGGGGSRTLSLTSQPDALQLRVVGALA